MSLAWLVEAMGLPTDARIDRRVPKRMLVEQAARTAADRRAIQDGIDEMHWVAALKPTNIGVPAYRNETREYVEIVVLTMALRAGAKGTRLVVLAHRAIPYPVVLIAGGDEVAGVSVAHKRWSQAEAGKVVAEDVRQTWGLHPAGATAEEVAFVQSLALSELPRGNLLVLYQALVDRVAALEAAGITGAYEVPRSAERSAAIREALAACAQLGREMAALRARATKEKQVSRLVELNLELGRLKRELAEWQELLRGQSA